ALERTMRVNLHGQASFMALETLVFGREAMGETVQAVKVQDSWDIYRDGTLIHAERLALGPSLPQGNATLGAAKALATFLMIAPEVEKLGAAIAEAAGEYGAVSCWNGKLVARLLASDGFNLRKAALRVIAAALTGEAVPKTWTM
ncbi:MAG: urease accessory protein UreD, partial [Alphaproteobacteria bacterium]|nr:urease accessory protein UreD [Alphaproteobacteria bacterium]